MITADDVERSIPVATAELDDGFFRVRTGRTSDPERAYLRAMAELGPGPVRSGEVAALLEEEDDRARADPGRPDQEGAVLLAALGRDRLHRADVRRVHEALDPRSPDLGRPVARFLATLAIYRSDAINRT